MKKIPILIIGIIFVFSFFYFKKMKNNDQSVSETTASPAVSSNKSIREPISNAMARVTKKPFGIYITPANSPVQPEKFTGYHTGTDFETTVQEQNADVSVYAICDGRLALKETATGYGGVAVESCSINNEAVTVVYGHIRLSSVALKAGQEIHAGDRLAVLGTGYSSETDGERKHLHLGIHKGAATNIKGYVQNESELVNWLNINNYL
jgi:murein DD-endopeptidase MepM/ murein hydrolase activator NlpD